MDFITSLPRVQGKDCIFVVVDRLTKFAHVFAIPTDYKAIQVAELFFREVFRLHGLPRQIVSDRAGRFISVHVYAIIIVLCISIDKSIIRTRSLRNTHS
jgi:hypothetical protein